MRHSPAERVVSHVEKITHPGIYVNVVVTAPNRERLEQGAESILAIEQVRGILFHLFTPYLGADRALRLSLMEREGAIGAVHRLTLRHPGPGDEHPGPHPPAPPQPWPRPLWSSVTINRGELTSCCCRAGIADAATCAACGCTPAVETFVLERLRPTAVLDYLRFL